MKRLIQLPVGRAFSVAGSAALSDYVPDSLIDRLLGIPGAAAGRHHRRLRAPSPRIDRHAGCGRARRRPVHVLERSLRRARRRLAALRLRPPDHGLPPRSAARGRRASLGADPADDPARRRPVEGRQGRPPAGDRPRHPQRDGHRAGDAADLGHGTRAEGHRDRSQGRSGEGLVLELLREGAGGHRRARHPRRAHGQRPDHLRQRLPVRPAHDRWPTRPAAGDRLRGRRGGPQAADGLVLWRAGRASTPDRTCCSPRPAAVSASTSTSSHWPRTRVARRCPCTRCSPTAPRRPARGPKVVTRHQGRTDYDLEVPKADAPFWLAVDQSWSDRLARHGERQGAARAPGHRRLRQRLAHRPGGLRARAVADPRLLAAAAHRVDRDLDQRGRRDRRARAARLQPRAATGRACSPHRGRIRPIRPSSDLFIDVRPRIGWRATIVAAAAMAVFLLLAMPWHGLTIPAMVAVVTALLVVCYRYRRGRGVLGLVAAGSLLRGRPVHGAVAVPSPQPARFQVARAVRQDQRARPAHTGAAPCRSSTGADDPTSCRHRRTTR